METQEEVKCGRWEILTGAGLSPSIRSGHSLVSFNGALFAFGGFDGTVHYSTLDACILGTPAGTATWSPLFTQQPQQPKPRTLHTAVVHAGSMWVFGGSSPRGPARRNPFSSFFSAAAADDGSSAALNSVAKFDFARREWEDVVGNATTPAALQPRARDGHSCVVHNGMLVVYGGSDDTALFDDVAVFDCATRAWMPVHTAGAIPPARRLHSAVVAAVRGEPAMVVFGGYNGRVAFNDIHVLQLRTMTWVPIQPADIHGTPPTPRFGHSAVVRGRFVYVFGGYGSGRGFRRDMWRLNLDEWRWEPVAAIGDAVAARRCHAATLVTLQDGSEAMAVFGGATSLPTASHLNDTLLFRFSEEGSSVTDEPSSSSSASSMERASGLGADLLRIMDDPAFADVTLSVADRKLVIRAHRAILVARSPVFDRLFRSGMRDSAAGAEVVIDECSPEAFAAFMRWMYSGSPAEDDAGLAAELLALAERYMTPGLKPWCEQALLAAMDEASVTGILAVSDRFECKRLCRAAVAFAARHYKAVAKDPEFAKLPQRLLLEIMEELSKFQP